MKRILFWAVGLLIVPVSASAAETLNILGVRAGDDLTSAEKVLMEKGFKRVSGGLNNCGSTYEQRMQAWARRGRMTVLLGDIGCSERMEKGRARVVLTSLMSPHGYVVQSAEYTDKSTETMAELEKRLAEKFGRPEKRTGFAEWSMPSGSHMPARLHNYGGDFAPSLKLEALSVMSDTFLEEIEKDLRSRAGRAKTAL